MAIKISPALNQFNGGELSPDLEGRYDLDKYNYSAKVCKNFIPTVEGVLKRRNGSHFVRQTKYDETQRYLFSVNIFNSKSIPTLYVDGVKTKLKYYGITQGEIKYHNYSTTDDFDFEVGSEVKVRVECIGFQTLVKTIVVDYSPISDTIVELTPETEEEQIPVTINVLPFNSEVELFLNNEKVNTITVNKGSVVYWSASTLIDYGTGYFKAEESNYFLYAIDNEIYIKPTSELLEFRTARTLQLQLPESVYEVACVGGGGGALMLPRKNHDDFRYYDGIPSTAIVCRARLRGKLDLIIGKAKEGGFSPTPNDHWARIGQKSEVGRFINAGCPTPTYRRGYYVDDSVLVNIQTVQTTYKGFGRGGRWNGNLWRWGTDGYVSFKIVEE